MLPKNQPEHDGEALDDVGDCVGEQSAHDRIGRHQGGGERDRGCEAKPGVGAHDLAEGAHLGRGPDDRARYQHDDHQPLNAGRIALAEQVRKGSEPAFPQRTREEGPHEDDRCGVPQGVNERTGQPPLVHCAA